MSGQNFNDMNLTNVQNGDAIVYNGTSNKWINQPSSTLGTTYTISNVGSQVGEIFRDESPAGTFNLKTIQGTNDITITNNTNDISIDSDVTGNNVGGQIGEVFRDKTGSNINMKTIQGGQNINITNNANNISIDFDRIVDTDTTTPTYSSFIGVSGITLTHDAFGIRIGNIVHFTISCVANVTSVAGFVSFRATVPWNPNNDWGMSNANRAEGSGILETLGQPENVIFKADTTSKTYRATWTSVGAGSYLLKLRGSYRIDN